VGFQATVSILLLCVTALLARSAVHASHLDVGFDAAKLITLSPRFSPDAVDATAARAYYAAVDAAVRGLSTIEGVALAADSPATGSFRWERVGVGDAAEVLYSHRIGAGYFDVMGLPLVRGRSYTPDEVAHGASVVVITDRFARAFVSGDPIGRTLSSVVTDGETGEATTVDATIVGVVADAVSVNLWNERRGSVYRPIGSDLSHAPVILVRTANPPAVMRAIDDVVRPIDRRIAVSASTVLRDIRMRLEGPTVMVAATVPIAALSFALALLGIYGVTTFLVTRRMREFGIRVAVGASAGDIMGLLLRQNLRPVFLGCIVGIIAAVGFSSAFASQLSGTSPYDPLAFGSALATLLGGAAVAIMIPAHRAARTDPAVALKDA
jgi:hypothetical protein